MWLILGIFFLGIITGSLLKKVKQTITISNKLTFYSVLFLLFFLGYQAGSNNSVRTHFDTLGIQGVSIAILSITGSTVFIMLFAKFLLKR